jgi:hypothetical protein
LQNYRPPQLEGVEQLLIMGVVVLRMLLDETLMVQLVLTFTPQQSRIQAAHT